MCNASSPLPRIDWGLRDYDLPPSEWGDGWSGCLGLEPDPRDFLVHFVEVFQEIKRVLRRDGTCWMNMGDSYVQGGRGGVGNKSTLVGTKTQEESLKALKAIGGRLKGFGLNPKQRMLMPARCALSLQEAGWWVRSEIVWNKPNAKPSSVVDRPTDSHEMLYLLTKNSHYFYDSDAIRTDHSPKSFTVKTTPRKGNGVESGGERFNKWLEESGNGRKLNPLGANKRTVWTISTQAFPDAHFATFPEKLVEPCILAGTSERGACVECGAPWLRVVKASGGTIGKSWNEHKNDLKRGDAKKSGAKDYKRETLGWKPGCAHDSGTRPCVVLDPFSGSGTTGVVSLRHNRSYVGIELSPKYADMSKRRIVASQAAWLGASEDEARQADATQLGLFS